MKTINCYASDENWIDSMIVFDHMQLDKDSDLSVNDFMKNRWNFIGYKRESTDSGQRWITPWIWLIISSLQLLLFLI
jgi:hypothetical protein